MSDYDVIASAKENIAQHGVNLTYVFDPEESDPPFCYTSGLTAISQPELIVSGWPPGTCGAVLNAVAKDVRAGLTLQEGIDYPGYLVDYPVRFRACGTGVLNVAKAIYGKVLALQLLWPDAEGRFPPDWEVTRHRLF